MRSSALLEAVQARWRLNAEHFDPTRVTIKITSRCNLRCSFCEIGSEHGGTELPYEDVTRLLDFARDRGARVFLSGGEPFVHSRIWDILRHCTQIGLKVSLVTNATRLHALSAAQQRTLNDAVSMMSVSIDAASAEEHDRIRGIKGSFEKARAYVTSKERTHGLGLNTVLALDFSNVEPMIEFCAQHEVSVNFQPVIFDTNFPDLERAQWKIGVEDRMAELAENAASLRDAVALADRLGVTTNLQLLLFFIEDYYRDASSDAFFFDKLFLDFMCFTPLNALVVDEKGQIMPCLFLEGDSTIYDEDWPDRWRAQGIAHRESWASGQRYAPCKSCSCHFAENLRCNVVAHPLKNHRQLAWFARYYATRLRRSEGRVQ